MRIKRNRVYTVAATGGTIYGVSLIALNQAWYKNYPKSSFHFFNDNNEWMQMDKCGHAFTAYYEGVYGYKMLRWAGLNNRQASLWGATWGFILQTPIEILDGYSSAWGFSWGDFAANTFGAGLNASQQFILGKQPIQLKFSFTPTKYERIKPNLLGSNFAEALIKDYNGQTYWVSIPISILAGQKIPDWLNVALGYGADGMLRGTYIDQKNDGSLPAFRRTRQFYLSPDVNLLMIKPKSKAIKQLLTVLSFIKFPAPALELRDNGNFRFHLLYF